MIYLIDDKKARQKDFGWTEEKFAQYANHLTPLYTIDDVVKIGEKLYSVDNIILYHESFLDFTGDREKAVEQRNKLAEKAASNNLLSVAFFSGSQSSRSLSQNTAYLPVAILYQNLEVLLQQYYQASGNLKYLLFGENPEIEEKLNEFLVRANREIEQEAVEVSGNKLFIRPTMKFIQNAIIGATEGKIFNDVSDEKLSEKINEWLSKTEYDNIFIPLCFGQTLSDYNGLRLATHIRCTETPNQLKRIFIYGFVGIEYLLQNEYFNMLKTKNVELVDYSKKAFQISVSRNFSPMKPEELPKEIKKLELNPPKDYIDHHSIANEWAIHQWAKTIGCDETEELQKLFQNVKCNLYFKYLRTVHPISVMDNFSLEKLKIDYKDNPKVLLIDDEAEKGWDEIFAFLLYDLNKIDVDYIGHNFKNCTSDEIIRQSIDKIKVDDIDIVILDFRLNSADFENTDPEKITGIKLLRRIKTFNPGIQVIVFSATNKVWNLQCLQDAGADGFVIKEASENSDDLGFTSKSISNFVNLFTDAAKNIFLKDLYKLLFNAKKNLEECDYEDDSDFELFLKELRSQINIIEQGCRQTKAQNSITLDVVFLSCYNFLEMLKNFYLKEKDYRFYIGIEEIPLCRYSYDYVTHSIKNEGEYVRNGKNDSPSWFQCIAGLSVDYFQAMKSNDPDIKSLWQVRKWRNDYIHDNKSYFSRPELLKIAQLVVKVTSLIKE